MKKNLLKGSLFTIGASLWWGVIGVFYFKFVSFASPLELTIHRTIWTALLLVITTSYYSKWPEFKKLVKKPKNITNKQAMTLGTAGFTSLMSAFAIKAREEILLGEKVNNVLVTGATGGVGSVAVIALNKMGYNVTAVTGKDSKADYLKSLGAKRVVNRAEFDKDPRLIDKGLWDGVVDTVGGKILANAIVQTNPNGIIAVCGNANTNELNTSVIPFMLRGIKLWGMDSANCSIKRREFIWSEAANLIDFSLLERSVQTVSLEELIETYPKILKGEISGRVLVDLNK